jgi:superfamily II DNA or RNA helicase
VSFQLRPYQAECRDAVLRDLATHRSVVAVLPTAAGKTIIAAAIAEKMPGPVLVLAHRGELLEQAAEKFRGFGFVPDLEKADSWASLSSPLVLASVQSLQNNRLDRFPPDHFKFIWIDECHHAPAFTYRIILDRFSDAKVFGCTATLDRLDGEGYEEIFEKISYEKSLVELIREGWLAPLRVRTLPVKIDLRGVRRTAGDFNIGDLSEAIGRELEKAADQVAKNLAGRIKALCFTPTIHEAEIFAQLLQERGIAAEPLSGQSIDRDEIVARFRNSQIKVLCNCMVLTEGFDCPDCDTIILLRPTQSRALPVQQIGRVTRLWPTKEFGLLLDFFWLTARHKLCRPADIEGVERESSPEEAPPLVPGDHRKSLDQKLAEEGALEEEEYDPFAFEPVDPFDIDAYLELPKEFASSYQLEEPTQKQIDTLHRLGIPIICLKNRGVVDGLFDIFKRRWAHGLATVPQVKYLRILGHPDPWNASFQEANEFISEHKRKW